MIYLGKTNILMLYILRKIPNLESKKYTYNKYQKNEKELKNEPKNISEIWLVQKYNNCRYNAFITLFYFVYSSFIKNIKDENCKLLIELNDLIIKLSKDVNDKNYYDIIIFLQKHKFDSNNYLIDEIINEEDDDKKADLINKLGKNISIDTYSSGYVAQLFTFFKNIVYFNLIEKKYSECILCKKKKIDIVKERQPFLYINKNNIILKKIFNIL